MSAQLEILLTEKSGGDTQPSASPGASGAPQSDRIPGPADKVTGPKKADSLGRDMETAVRGLTNTAIELRKAFSKLYDEVTKNAENIGKRRADSGGPVVGEVKSPQKPQEPAPGPSIPKVGTFERQAAKGSIEAPPQTRAVGGPLPSVGFFERNAAKGTVDAPPIASLPGAPKVAPVVGPVAGEGAAAMSMARLAAVAGPAAMAVAALAVAVGAGVVVIKKAFDLMNSEANRLAGLSGSLSASTTINAVRAEFADIRRANRIGPQLASVNDTSGRIMSKVADVNTELLKVVVDLANLAKPVVPLLTNALDLIAAGIPVGTDTLVALLQFATGNVAAALEIDAKEKANLNRLVGSIGRLIANEVEDAKSLQEDPFATAFLGSFGERGKPPARRAPPAPKPKAPVRFGNPVGGFVRP